MTKVEHTYRMPQAAADEKKALKSKIGWGEWISAKIGKGSAAHTTSELTNKALGGQIKHDQEVWTYAQAGELLKWTSADEVLKFLTDKRSLKQDELNRAQTLSWLATPKIQETARHDIMLAFHEKVQALRDAGKPEEAHRQMIAAIRTTGELYGLSAKPKLESGETFQPDRPEQYLRSPAGKLYTQWVHHFRGKRNKEPHVAEVQMPLIVSALQENKQAIPKKGLSPDAKEGRVKVVTSQAVEGVGLVYGLNVVNKADEKIASGLLALWTAYCDGSTTNMPPLPGELEHFAQQK